MCIDCDYQDFLDGYSDDNPYELRRVTLVSVDEADDVW